MTCFSGFSAVYQLFRDPTSANCNAMLALNLCLTYEKCSRMTAPEIIICISVFVQLSVFPWPSSRNWKFLLHRPLCGARASQRHLTLVDDPSDTWHLHGPRSREVSKCKCHPTGLKSCSCTILRTMNFFLANPCQSSHWRAWDKPQRWTAPGEEMCCFPGSPGLE